MLEPSGGPQGAYSGMCIVRLVFASGWGGERRLCKIGADRKRCRAYFPLYPKQDCIVRESFCEALLCSLLETAGLEAGSYSQKEFHVVSPPASGCPPERISRQTKGLRCKVG